MTTTTLTVAAPAAVDPPTQFFRTLVAEHEKTLLAYAEKLLNDRHTAEDIVQETLIRAWPHAERLYSTDGSVRGWLLTVTRNLVIDRMRTATARRETVGAEGRDASLPDHADAVLASVDTATLLRQLSPEHREVLLHTYVCDRTVQETARILGIPTGTVKSRQHYALTSLRTKARGSARTHQA
ncbi:sigma-70 family RNA polymerase sigma factor [Streptomyces sp. NPDC004658]|uniref:sigma-70 family RNA polymerase sigma factor n=1 Tax=Streptomyces sp. NPDC004658 TaxID=3154672 RepID=UPI0033B8FEA6